MKFKDTLINQTERFTLGVETLSGTPYLSIPVSNRLVDYEEYYEISSDSYELFLNDRSAASDFAERCRNRQEDQRLMLKPGSDRGVAS